MEQVRFTQMKDGAADEYRFLQKEEIAYARKTGDRVLVALTRLKEGFSGYQVTRYEHSLQVASRAWRDGADRDWVVSALLHDMGDFLAPHSHDKYAAMILAPFVREQCRWCVEMHGEFQLIYYGQYYDGYNQNKRDQHRDHPYFDDCAEFCERWDQVSFDPNYNALPLEFFGPLVADVFARRPNDPAIIEANPQPLINTVTARERLKRDGITAETNLW